MAAPVVARSRVRVNYFKILASISNAKEFGRKAEEICIQQGLNYYIKESLRKEMNA